MRQLDITNQRLQDCLTSDIQKWMNLSEMEDIAAIFGLQEQNRYMSSVKLDGKTRESLNKTLGVSPANTSFPMLEP